MNDNDTEQIECPDCEGSGYVEVMTWLTYNGHQTWRTEECETCHGSGTVEVEPDEDEEEDQDE